MAKNSTAEKQLRHGASNSGLGRSDVSQFDGEKTRWEEPAPLILVVDDDVLIQDQLERLYRHSGYEVAVASSAEQALERLEKGDIDLVVTDIRLGRMSGVQLTKRMQEICPDVPVIVITGYADIETAVAAFKLGASDYIVKPFSVAALQESARVALDKTRIFVELRHLRRAFNDSYEFEGLVSKTPEMYQVFGIIRMVSIMDVTVLVEGETGTGKELVAKAIHHRCPRQKGPFLAINCAGIPETLLDSELFGYEQGAFTGANAARPGKIELAHRGTLFLDEIESMSLSMQAKLLRVLEDKKVQRLGSSQAIQVDVRVIAASNVPTSELVAQGKMRKDFYYRINVVPIKLIPLRERREDIPLLVGRFLSEHPFAVQKRISRVSRRAMDRLMQYSWPGNIRELQNVLEKSLVLATSPIIEKVYLPEETLHIQGEEGARSIDLPFHQWIKEQEKLYIMKQLGAFGGRVGIAAKNSGLPIRTLSRKMRIYGIDKKEFSAYSPIPFQPATIPAVCDPDLTAPSVDSLRKSGKPA